MLNLFVFVTPAHDLVKSCLAEEEKQYFVVVEIDISSLLF